MTWEQQQKRFLSAAKAMAGRIVVLVDSENQVKGPPDPSLLAACSCVDGTNIDSSGYAPRQVSTPQQRPWPLSIGY